MARYGLGGRAISFQGLAGRAVSGGWPGGFGEARRFQGLAGRPWIGWSIRKTIRTIMRMT